MLLNLGVVDAQELVGGGGHIDEVRLTFSPLTVKELVYRLVLRGAFKMGADNLKQGLTQMRRATLGGADAL